MLVGLDWFIGTYYSICHFFVIFHYKAQLFVDLGLDASSLDLKDDLENPVQTYNFEKHFPNVNWATRVNSV